LVKVTISYSSSLPIYEQIISQIRHQIINGQLKENDSLPSIRKLAKELGISIVTTKRAYDELEKESLIHTVRGKGSFIARQNKKLIREKKMKFIEEKVSEAVSEAKNMGISLRELIRMLSILYNEE